jgi:hypothetical protein
MSNSALRVQPGERFGRLTVIARTGLRDEKGHAILLCACDCGERCEKNSTSLRTGRVRSCGCLQRAVTPAAVLEVLSSNESQRALARRLRLSQRTVGRIRRGESWAGAAA